MGAKRIIIAGGGFAGLSAFETAASLTRNNPTVEILLIDSRERSDFLPMLPDIIGRGLTPGFLEFDIPDLVERKGGAFLRGRVDHMDLSSGKISVSGRDYDYDVMLTALGSVTNFYGNTSLEESALKMDNVEDAVNILKEVDSGKWDNYVISGAGYTGIEIATAIKRRSNVLGREVRVIVAELSDSILGPLPGWMKIYTSDNTRDMGVELLTGVSVEDYQDGKIRLSDGTVIADTLLIWSAGVNTPDCVREMPLEKDRQGRLKVDGYLRAGNRCYAAGDCARVERDGKALRMGIQFGITGGMVAGANMVAELEGSELRRFDPFDPGYIVPMANGKSCGLVMGAGCRGRLPTILHYFMCIYRTRGYLNRKGVIKDLFKDLMRKGGRKWKT